MQKWLASARFNFVRLFQWHRILGIGSLCVIAYILVFFVFNKTDVTGFLPPRDIIRFHWPDLPHFTFTTQPASDGKPAETLYQVPTRQITKEELSQLPTTNQP